MGRDPGGRGGAVTLRALGARWSGWPLLLLVALGCKDADRSAPPSWTPPVVEASAAAVAPSSVPAAATITVGAAPAPPTARQPGAPPRDGDTSVEALIQRARVALAEGNDRDVVRCLEPGARRAWLGDALLAIEVAAQVPRYEDALARRRGLLALRERVMAHVPGGPPRRPASLSADVVGEALLARIEAPDDLLAELLTVSRSLGYPLDPVAAATEGRVGTRAAETPTRTSPGGAGLGRALQRIERSVELAEVHLVDDRGIALVRDPDGGLEPVRLVRRGDTVWLDDS